MAFSEINSPAHCKNANEESEPEGDDDTCNTIWVGTKQLLHFNDPECCEGIEIDTTEGQDEERWNNNSLPCKLDR